MPATKDDLLSRLGNLGIAHRTHEHAAVYTVEEARALRGDIPGGHCRNLFLKDKKGKVFLVVLLEDTEVDLKRIHTVIGASGRVSFGKPDLLMKLLGVIPGAVTPFGLINDTAGTVSVVLDAAMMEHEILNFHPITNEATTSISSADLARFVEATGHEPRVLDVSVAATAAVE